MEETNANPFLDDQEKLETKKKESVPANYIPVKLSSMGKLSVPKIIHVRNYSGEETLKLSTMNEDNSIQVLIDVIQNLIWEDIDALDMNENEVEELMLNIYVNWWNTIIDYPYEWNEEELKLLDDEKRVDTIRSGQEIPKVQINISNIKTMPIISEFKEPIVISHAGIKYYFRLSRVRDMIEAKNFVTDKYLEEENKFAQIKKDLDYNSKAEGSTLPLKNIDPREHRAYREYLTQRALDFEKVSQMGKVIKFGTVEIKNTEDRLNNYKNIPSDIWVKLNEVINESIQFGVNPELKVVSPITNEEITRRFQFQVLDFIPAMELPDSSEYAVAFGEQ